ncbi:MAG: hypothetical protein ABIN57_02435 [Chitinophagaceae bacterium]
MKNKLIALTLLIVAIVSFSSCASSKYGCPATQGTHGGKFRS